MSDDKLKDMMDKASTASKSGDAIRDTHKLSRKQKGWITGGSIAAVVVVAGMIFLVPSIRNHNSFVDMTGQTSQSVRGDGIGDFGDLHAPIKLQNWQQSPGTWQVRGNKTLLHTANSTAPVYNAITPTFNSGSNTTDDVTQSVGKDGMQNKNFSYLTGDNVKIAYTDITNRLINPVYGDWYKAQFAKNNPKSMKSLNELKTLFSDSWWKSNISSHDYSALPLFADWDADNYGGQSFKPSVARWYGQITKHVIMPSTDAKTAEFKGINVVDTIKYSAYDKDGDVINKTGTLKMTLIPNHNLNEGMNGNRLVIDSAKLTIE